MRKYIILAYNISGMGGGQQYVYNKVKYLTAKGFDAVVYSAVKGEMVIRDFQRFHTQVIPALKYPPACFRGSYRERILDKLSRDCKEDYQIWIESTGIYETQWAELLAEKVHGKHVCFNLQEQQNKQYSEDVSDFFFYKYLRKEMYGIAPESLALMFRGVHEIPDSKEYRFIANCINVVDKTMKYTGPALPEADYRLGCIWRTNKEGFLETVKHLIPFISGNPDKTFAVVVIGGGSRTNEEKAAKLLEAHSNVSALFLGYTYPIPLELLKSMDVFVSSAGSANVTAMNHIPTISVTTKVCSGEQIFCPIGIVDYTTMQTVVPEENDKTLSDFLKMVLLEKYCANHSPLGKVWPVDADFVGEYSRELAFFERTAAGDYYPVMNIKPSSLREKGYMLLGRLFGCRILAFVDACLHRIKEVKY